MGGGMGMGGMFGDDDDEAGGFGSMGGFGSRRRAPSAPQKIEVRGLTAAAAASASPQSLLPSSCLLPALF